MHSPTTQAPKSCVPACRKVPHNQPVCVCAVLADLARLRSVSAVRLFVHAPSAFDSMVSTRGMSVSAARSAAHSRTSSLLPHSCSFATSLARITANCVSAAHTANWVSAAHTARQDAIPVTGGGAGSSVLHPCSASAWPASCPLPSCSASDCRWGRREKHACCLDFPAGKKGACCCDANSPGCCHTPPRRCRHLTGASPCGCPCGLGRSSPPGISREGGGPELC